MLPILSLVITCQPCAGMTTGDHLAAHTPVIAILKNGKKKPEPKGPERTGSRGAFEADVVLVLKGTIKEKRITVRWDYGMCGYPAPNVSEKAAVVFLTQSANGWAPGSTGCGPVQLDYDEAAKTITVDRDVLSIAQFKKRYP